MRILGALLLSALLLYALAVAGMALLQRPLMYPGAFDDSSQAPVAVPARVAKVQVHTADGETLHALWAPPLPGCGTVLSFHGNGSRPEWHAERFADDPWRNHGWGVLAIAYRGYAGSTGTPSEAGLIEDGLAAYRAVQARAPGTPILLHGHSLGAAVAVAVAERHPHLGLYLEAPFDSMSRLVRILYPYLPTDLLLRDTYRSDARIARGDAPVLIVHGRADAIVPASLGTALARAAGPRARLLIVEADHDTVVALRDDEAEALFRAGLGQSCSAATEVPAP